METWLNSVVVLADGDVVGADFAVGEAAPGGAGTTVPAGEGAPAGQPQGGGGLFGGGSLIWIMLLMLVVMFFFTSRSNKKNQQRRQEMINEITKGSKVATTSGMFGTVAEVRDDSFLVEVAPNVKIEFAKAAIAGRRDEAAGDKGGKKDKDENSNLLSDKQDK